MTREEVQIRLGIDSTALKMGLESSTGYMARWRKQQTAAEREYTSFWKSELDKRDAAEIESATRRNRARSLLRQRAAAREDSEGDKGSFGGQLEHALTHGARHLVGALGIITVLETIKSSIETKAEEIRKIYDQDDEHEKERIKRITDLSDDERHGILLTADALESVGEAKSLFIGRMVGSLSSLFEWLGKLSTGSKTKRLADEQEVADKLKPILDEQEFHFWEVNKQRIDNHRNLLNTILEMERHAARVVDSEMTRRLKITVEQFQKMHALLEQIKSVRVGLAEKSVERVSAFRDMSAVSLSDAQRITTAATGGPRLAGLRFSKDQMSAINMEQELHEQAQQARINGDMSRAALLTSRRNDLLKKMPWLTDAERDPLKKLNDSIIDENQKLRDLMTSASGLNATIVGVRDL